MLPAARTSGSSWASGAPGHGVGDINGNGTVDGVDLGMLLAAWGPVD